MKTQHRTQGDGIKAGPINAAKPADSEAGWRLPSGLQMVEFALKGGFIAPGLLPKVESTASFSWKPPVAGEAAPRSTRSARRKAEAPEQAMPTGVGEGRR